MDKFLSSVERRAYYMAKSAVEHPEEALDIVQDAMMNLVQRYATRPEEQWRALFFKILESRIMDWHRRQKVRNRWRIWLNKLGFGDSEGDPSGLDQFPDQREPQPCQQLHNRQSMTSLNRAVEQLPLRQQQAFLLRTLEGMSVAETATAMGCSQGSVKTHYSRATHTLRDVLKEYAP